MSNLRRDQRASLLIESGQEYANLKGVEIKSRAEIVDDYDVVVDTMHIISRRTSYEKRSKSLEDALFQSARKLVVLKFIPQDYISWDHQKFINQH